MSAENEQLKKLLNEFGGSDGNSLSQSTRKVSTSLSQNTPLISSQSPSSLTGSSVVNALAGSLGLSGGGSGGSGGRSSLGGSGSGNGNIGGSPLLSQSGGIPYKPLVDEKLSSQSPLETGNNFGIEQELLRIIDKKDHKSATHDHSAYNNLDELDFTVLRFGTNVSIQGNNSRYLEAMSIGSSVADPTGGSVTSNIKPNNVYHLGVKGQGIGEASNCLIINSIDSISDRSPIRYGSLVCIRSPFAKDRFLGVKGGTLGFFRDILTQSEKWAIVKGSKSNNNSNSDGLGRGSVGGEGSDNAVGTYVRIGESLMLVSSSLFPTSGKELYHGPSGPSMVEQMLVLNEYTDGQAPNKIIQAPSLVHRTMATTSFGAEFWKIELFNSLANPDWGRRPYLSGSFLLSQHDRSPATAGTSRSAPSESLSSYPFNVQESILMRELLLALAGIEGDYIRIVDNNSTSSSNHMKADGFSRHSNRRDNYQPAIINSKRPSLGNIALTIDLNTADRSLANQVSLLLPLCEEAMQLKYYLKRHSRYEFGLVCHSIVTNMKDLIKEYDILVAQLEHLCNSDKLTLQKMYFLLQPARVSLQILHKLAKDTFDTTGGKALDLIYENYLNQGDSKARKLVGYILEKASEPFLNMLSIWIYRGELNDPYHEFMIQEDTSISKEALAEDFNAQYWENRHTLRYTHIPRFLNRLAEKILTAGKYLNVVRYSLDQSDDVQGGSSATSMTAAQSPIKSPTAHLGGFEMKSESAESQTNIIIPKIKSLDFDLDNGLSTLFESIELAYAFSSRALLLLLDKKHGIRSHFNSLRRFFLLEHGDFFIQFMDLAESELKKDVKDVSISRLHSVLNVAIQSSTLSSDMHRDDIGCQLASHNLLHQLLSIQSVGEGFDAGNAMRAQRHVQGLKGNESLVLDYKVTWPVSIVLSKRAITKYQLLSRLLYDSKHVERQLLGCWMGHQQTKQLVKVRFFLGEAYCLRQRMLHFLQNFVYYMTVEVISPRSHEMIEGMQQSLDIDQVLNLHEKFLDTCLKECLLNSIDLLKILLQLFNTCLQFSSIINEYLLNVFNENVPITQLGSNRSAVSGNEIPDIKTNNYFGASAFQISGKADSKSEIALAIMKQNRARKANNDKKASAIIRDTTHESFKKTLFQFNKLFDEQIKTFLEKLHKDSERHQPQLANLCVRIDYNGYYSGKFEDLDGK